MIDFKNFTQAEKIKKTFGQNLMALRKKTKMKRAEIAEKLNLSVATISAYENGVREPNFEKMIEIANLFHVSLDELFGRDPINSEKFFFQYRYEKAKQIIGLLGCFVIEHDKGRVTLYTQATGESEIKKPKVIATGELGLVQGFGHGAFLGFKDKTAFTVFIEKIERRSLNNNKSFQFEFSKLVDKILYDDDKLEEQDNYNILFAGRIDYDDGI